MRILVTGATGYVGSRLVTALLAEGHKVVTATRTPEKIKRFGWSSDVDAVTLDAGDPDATAKAFADAGPIDVVYYLVHAIGQPDFRDADNKAAAHVAEAAKAAGVKRIVYLGGFVPDGGDLSEHLMGRAEVAGALTIDGGAEVVWLGAAMIIGAGSTSFEMLRYVGDRFWLFPLLPWVKNPMDPISIRDVLYYLVAVADSERVPAGAYDISGPETTTYRELLFAYAHARHTFRAGVPIRGIDTWLVSKVTAIALPIPGGLASDLVASLDYPMRASEHRLEEILPAPPGGPTPINDAIAASLSTDRPAPVDALADPHHLADSDPAWAGGDVLALQRLARAVTPAPARPALGLVNLVPGPVAGALRTGFDLLAEFTPNGKSA
ncbi:MAG: hypothetical protein QOH57_3964 [Mycobacterium sp.]|nr:hypothetical protein [Mycobacterium sp.]